MIVLLLVLGLVLSYVLGFRDALRIARTAYSKAIGKVLENERKEAQERGYIA